MYLSVSSLDYPHWLCKYYSLISGEEDNLNIKIFFKEYDMSLRTFIHTALNTCHAPKFSLMPWKRSFQHIYPNKSGKQLWEY